MKIEITFKDPDGVFEAVRKAAKESMDGLPLTIDEMESIAEGREGDIRRHLSTWVEYGEYLTVEFDTESKTARVKEIAQ
jgi:hypothetical protein